MEHIELAATPREALSRGGMKAARKAGKIPASLYGTNVGQMALFLEKSHVMSAIKHITESSIINLRAGGKVYSVIIKEIQRDEITGDILHIDFNAIASGHRIHAKVPLHLTGAAKGVREGGILEHSIHDIEVECQPDQLPEKIDVDITNLEANHALHVRDLPQIPNVRILTNPDTVIAIIKFTRAEAEKMKEAEAQPQAQSAKAPAEEKK